MGTEDTHLTELSSINAAGHLGSLLRLVRSGMFPCFYSICLRIFLMFPHWF